MVTWLVADSMITFFNTANKPMLFPFDKEWKYINAPDSKNI